ncbi:hypothetical protein EKL94_16415 [Stenotrophomonas maltophilia]|uniref:Uncharacterized protein n=1 Tax=Stenotrophomonas maltophilia TaxID=40324 RepID=A0A431UD28_STEMA|nr:hypothetical protein EKL94_16415 [Stenotrophomonas maltophilia]
MSAGLRPAPAVVPAAGRQPQQQQQQQGQQRVSCGMAGWVRLRGTLQVRPCKLGRAIHGAHAPATGPTPPSTGSCDLS